MGNKSRVRGKRFEDRVRKQLEGHGIVVARWSNQVDMASNKLVPVRPMWNPFRKTIMYTKTGFPDFMCFNKGIGELRSIIGLECKLGKYLDADEKAKCKWLIENGIFNKIVIAHGGAVRGEIIYKEFDYQ